MPLYDYLYTEAAGETDAADGAGGYQRSHSRSYKTYHVSSQPLYALDVFTYKPTGQTARFRIMGMTESATADTITGARDPQGYSIGHVYAGHQGTFHTPPGRGNQFPGMVRVYLSGTVTFRHLFSPSAQAVYDCPYARGEGWPMHRGYVERLRPELSLRVEPTMGRRPLPLAQTGELEFTATLQDVPVVWASWDANTGREGQGVGDPAWFPYGQPQTVRVWFDGAIEGFYRDAWSATVPQPSSDMPGSGSGIGPYQFDAWPRTWVDQGMPNNATPYDGWPMGFVTDPPGGAGLPGVPESDTAESVGQAWTLECKVTMRAEYDWFRNPNARPAFDGSGADTFHGVTAACSAPAGRNPTKPVGVWVNRGIRGGAGWDYSAPFAVPNDATVSLEFLPSGRLVITVETATGVPAHSYWHNDAFGARDAWVYGGPLPTAKQWRQAARGQLRTMEAEAK